MALHLVATGRPPAAAAAAASHSFVMVCDGVSRAGQAAKRPFDGGGRSGDRVRLTAAAKQWVAAVTSADKVLTGGGA